MNTTDEIIHNSGFCSAAETDSDGGGDAAQIIRKLAQKGETVGFAESCTGGGVCRRMAAVPGASAVLIGAIVCYAPQIKTRILGVSPETIRKCGIVSRETAREMAFGARRALRCDWSCAVTGYAGPGGGDEFADVGTVCFAVASQSGIICDYRKNFTGTRGQIMQNAACFLLSELNRLI